MFHGAPKYSTETLKCSTEPLNIPQMMHGTPEYSMEAVKCCTETQNSLGFGTLSRGRSLFSLRERWCQKINVQKYVKRQSSGWPRVLGPKIGGM